DFDAGETAAGDYEGEQLAAQVHVVIFDRRLFQGADDVIAQVQGVSQILERQRVFGQTRHAAKVCDVAEREDQIIIRNDVRVRAKAGARRHHFVLQVDGFDIADVQVSARQQPADGADRIKQADAARYDFRQHRLKDKVVLFVDEDNLEIVAA